MCFVRCWLSIFLVRLILISLLPYSVRFSTASRSISLIHFQIQTASFATCSNAIYLALVVEVETVFVFCYSMTPPLYWERNSIPLLTFDLQGCRQSCCRRSQSSHTGVGCLMFDRILVPFTLYFSDIRLLFLWPWSGPFSGLHFVCWATLLQRLCRVLFCMRGTLIYLLTIGIHENQSLHSH